MKGNDGGRDRSGGWRSESGGGGGGGGAAAAAEGTGLVGECVNGLFGSLTFDPRPSSCR